MKYEEYHLCLAIPVNEEDRYQCQEQIQVGGVPRISPRRAASNVRSGKRNLFQPCQNAAW